MYTAQLEKNAGPFSIRYPRGNGVMLDWKKPFTEIEIGKGRKVSDGKDIAILSIGTAGNLVTKAVEILKTNTISAAHYDMRFVKPIDQELLHEVFKNFDRIITVEDGCIQGGMGSAVLEFMGDHGYVAKVKRLGMPDEFIEHGEPKELYEECGFSPSAIAETAQQLVNEKVLF
jgi:1-deoxy-D-xylulose-5-phosphate synthase